MMGVKSVITYPIRQHASFYARTGFYEILALRGPVAGQVRKVEVSADGGESGSELRLQYALGAIRPYKLSAFLAMEMAGPVQFKSRATMRQPAPCRRRAPSSLMRNPPALYSSYHYNAIQSWEVLAQDGAVIRNVVSLAC